MKFIKNLICFSLCAVIMLGASVVSFEEDGADGITADVSEKAKMYNALGISNFDLDKISGADKISRSDFCNIAASFAVRDLNLINAQDISDITSDDKGMYYLYNAEIINGASDGKLEPRRNILLSEAVKIFTDMLGYSYPANGNGGYLSGYMSTASKIGLLNGVTADENSELDLENLFTLLGNVIEVPVMEWKFGSNKLYKTDDNILAQSLGIYDGYGVVESVKDASLYSYDGTGSNKIVIGSKTYTADFDTSGLLGLNIDFYFREESGDDKLLYVKPTDENNKILTLDGEDITEYSNGTYTYEDKNGKEKKAHISDSTIYIYNGKKTDTMPEFAPEYGSAVLIDNNGDGKYEVLKVTDIKITVVSSVNKNALWIADKFDSAYDIKLDGASCDEYEIYSAKGEIISIGDVKSGDIAEVVKTNSALPVVKVKISADTVIGSADETGTSDGRNTVTVNGTEYKTSHRFDSLVKSGKINSLKLGEYYLFSLDLNGNIAYADKDAASDARIGFVFSSENDETNRKLIKFDMLDMSGTKIILPLAEKIKVDGGAKKKTADMKPTDFAVNTLIKFKMNIQGEITDIFYPDAVKDEFNTVFKNDNAVLRGHAAGRMIGEQVKNSKDDQTCLVKGDTKVFVVPKTAYETNSIDEDKVFVVDQMRLKVNTNYNFVGYNTNGDFGMVDTAMVFTENPNGFTDMKNRSVLAISKVIKKVCADGEIRDVIMGIENGAEVEVEVEDLRVGGGKIPYESGDVIFYNKTSGNKIRLADSGWTANEKEQLLVDFDKIKTDKNNAFILKGGQIYDNLKGDFIALCGAVYDTDEPYIYIDYSAVLSNDQRCITAVNTEATSARVYVYDEDKEGYRLGSVSEASGYKNGGKYSETYTLITGSWAVVIIYP